MFDRYAYDDAVAASDLPPGARLLAMLLARRAAGDGLAFPSGARLAREAGMGRRTVVRHLATLRRRGWLADTGDRRGPPGREVIVYRCTVAHVGCQIGARGVPDRHREASKEASKEEQQSIPSGMDATEAAPAASTGETMSTDEQPTLPGLQTAPGPSGESQETQHGPEPTPAPQKARAPFKSHREAEDWKTASALWRTLASGSLRPHRRIRPDRGGGHHLLRSLRVLGTADVLRTILWMTCSAEAYYLRDSDTPRGFDTLWNQRRAYPERAEEWMESDHRACVLAASHGVPLPEDMPVVHEAPKPAIDLNARAQAMARAAVARRRAARAAAEGADE